MQLLNYDYFLMQAMKRFLSAQDILLLKEKVSWKERLRYMVDMIKEQEERELMADAITQLQATNISQLNNYLTKQKEPVLEVSDLVKVNKLNLLRYHLTLTPNYPAKSTYRTNHQQFFKLTLRNRFMVKIDKQGV